MNQHRIEYVARDRTGITAVVTPTGVIDVDVVIEHIRAGHSRYYVAADDWRQATVRTLSVLGSPYLFANWDGSKRNNLHDVAFRAPTRSVPVVRRDRSRVGRLLGGLVAALLGRR